MSSLLQLNPELDRESLAQEFERKGRLQIRDVLTFESARQLRDILTERTPWSLAIQSGSSAPTKIIPSHELAAMTPGQRRELVKDIGVAGQPDYAFAYEMYPLVTAYLERWRPGSLHERLLEDLNSAEMLTFMKDVSGMEDIVKMDGQATLYGPGHFLWPHSDAESERGRRVAYVLNLTLGDWKAEWGGYLNFYDSDWDIEQAFRPRFNCLNLFRVPQWHDVSIVTAGAALARYAITGWARNR
ncbi:2OG-Fe(II) oxygenase [Sphingomonas alba]|uniref:2OG-Fe(II) oxygenase n=1 Tax=Sphingomonas alba TaxID=2908208 RepID=A0ABT0RLZ8_9SPHN|nr:2OG-Fe(II) oxygenase family protein [Sphingomonas alba]MCL6683615.1 2OG-Fe(II) oxygenase [Sphingomonas alba]